MQVLLFLAMTNVNLVIMIQKLLAAYINRRTFMRGSAVLAFTALLSNLLGLLRDRLLARHFGAGIMLDAYNAAFIVPNLLLNIFVAGALTAAFVPIFSQLIQESKKKEMNEFANSVLNTSVSVILIAGLLVFIFASQLGNLIVPGFDQPSKQLFASLTRLLIFSPLIFAISNTLGSILVAEENFLWYGLSPVFYNLGIVGGIVFLSGRYGIQGVVWGTIAGAILHLISRFFGLGRNRIAYRPSIKLDYYFKKYLRLMLPRMAGHPIEQITFLGFTVLASTIGAGSIAILNIANNFQTVPVAIIGVTFALTSFPILSKIAAGNKKREFVDEIIFTSKAIFITTMPVALLMYLFSRPIISLLVGGGAFNKTAIDLTSLTLALFCPSIVTESVNHLLARAFYALKNSVIPTLVALGGMAIALAVAYAFAKSIGVPGLALGFLAGSIFKILLHAVFLKKQTGKVFKQELFVSSISE